MLIYHGQNIMNSSTGLRFLRPYLQKDLPAATKTAYLRFFSTSRALCHENTAVKAISDHPSRLKEVRAELQERIVELKNAGALQWPRIQKDKTTLRISTFSKKYSYLQPKDKLADHTVRINGRLKGFRVAGSKLVFLDLVQDGVTVQVVLEKKTVTAVDGDDTGLFREFYRLIRRGDIICRSTKMNYFLEQSLMV